jgi:hypothetical protein
MKHIYFNQETGCFLEINCDNIEERFLSIRNNIKSFDKEDIEFLFGLEPLPYDKINLFVHDVLTNPNVIKNIYDSKSDNKVYIIEDEEYSIVAANKDYTLFRDNYKRLTVCHKQYL